MKFVVSGCILIVSVLVGFDFLARWEVCRLFFLFRFYFSGAEVLC